MHCCGSSGQLMAFSCLDRTPHRPHDRLGKLGLTNKFRFMKDTSQSLNLTSNFLLKVSGKHLSHELHSRVLHCEFSVFIHSSHFASYFINLPSHLKVSTLGYVSFANRNLFVGQVFLTFRETYVEFCRDLRMPSYGLTTPQQCKFSCSV